MAIQDITQPILFGGGYVKRMSSTLGLGSTPSNVEIDIIVDTDGQLGTVQSFATGLLYPGNISGITCGNFKFWGVSQSWNKSWSINGISYTSRLVDPRIIFNDVHIIANGKGPLLPNSVNLAGSTGIYNVINVWDYYGSDPAAQYNEHGMPWNKIKNALESTGMITLYNKQFKLIFATGFNAPDYFRINGDEYSLDSCINTAANALGVDYYVEIDPTGYNPNNLVNNIYIRSIERDISATGIDLEFYILTRQATGTLMSYNVGKELRSGPTDVLLLGGHKKFMQSCTSIFPSYGRMADGRVLTGAGNNTSLGASFKPLDDLDRHLGYVILDKIVSSNPALLSDLPTLNPEGRTRYLSSSNYPPGVIVNDIDDEVYGYRPTENVMRASLFSQASWEAMLYKEQLDIARKLNISGIALREPGDTTRWISSNFVNPFGDGPKIRSELLGNIYRLREHEAIIKLFYEATRNAADTYYGREWLISLPTNTAYISTSTTGAGLNFRYGYKITDAGWYENASNVLKQSANNSFRTNDGLHKAHIVLNNAFGSQSIGIITNPSINFIGTTYDLRLDLNNWSKDKYLKDSSDLYLSCSVEQDNTNLARAIVRIDNPIEIALSFKISDSTGWFRDRNNNLITWYMSSTGIPSSYLEFWLAMGASFDQLNSLSSIYDNNQDLGLAPQRITNLSLINVPIENELSTYGPFVASGSRHGGTSLIRDDSLAPWTYGGINGMTAAGTALSNMSLMNKDVIDTASFVVAGLPEYNLGELLGDNANITSLGINYGIDGLTTNYTLQTYIAPITRMAKILNYKVDELRILTNKIKKDVINLDNIIKQTTESESGYELIDNTPVITQKDNDPSNKGCIMYKKIFNRTSV